MKEGRPLLFLAFVLALCALAAIGIATASHAEAEPCVIHGQGTFTVPDNRCTPGRFVHKTRADVCDGNTQRPNLPARERRAILGRYGLVTWTGLDGELDHRVPLVLGGTTDRANVWPEREVDGVNPKDRLEFVIYRRVCFGDPHPMGVTTATRIFLADWRPAYTYYVEGKGPRPVP